MTSLNTSVTLIHLIYLMEFVQRFFDRQVYFCEFNIRSMNNRQIICRGAYETFPEANSNHKINERDINKQTMLVDTYKHLPRFIKELHISYKTRQYQSVHIITEYTEEQVDN